MSLTPDATRSCAGCSAPLHPGSPACSNCGYVSGAAPHTHLPVRAPVPPVFGYPGAPVRVVAAKSPGVAAVLSIWLGVGHLYVGVNGLGFCLLGFYLFLCLMSFIPVLWILTIPVWFVAFVFTAMNASKAAHDVNRRNGISVH